MTPSAETTDTQHEALEIQINELLDEQAHLLNKGHQHSGSNDLTHLKIMDCLSSAPVLQPKFITQRG